MSSYKLKDDSACAHCGETNHEELRAEAFNNVICKTCRAEINRCQFRKKKSPTELAHDRFHKEQLKKGTNLVITMFHPVEVLAKQKGQKARASKIAKLAECGATIKEME